MTQSHGPISMGRRATEDKASSGCKSQDAHLRFRRWAFIYLNYELGKIANLGLEKWVLSL